MIHQRPLIGEPLSLDLLNTEWLEGEQHQDLLTTLVGTVTWLEEVGLGQENVSVEEVRQALLQTRAAIRSVLAYPKHTVDRDNLNAILTKGRILEQLGPEGPQFLPEVPQPWLVSWLAARNLLELMRRAPDRIRLCAHPGCILYFFDTSKNGSRRWCNMKTCGNRAKANRHYQLTKSKQ